MRTLLCCLFLVVGFLPIELAVAQELPMEKVDRDTYTFSTKEVKLVKDFLIDGPTYHITDDPYSFKLVALAENREPDTTVDGVFPFIINGQQADVRFRNGEALIEMNLGEADELTVQLANTKVSQTIDILRRPSWPALAGVGLFLLLTWIFRHALARGWRKLTGSEK